MGATFTHLLIWNFDDLKGAWNWATPSGIRALWKNFNIRFWQDNGMRDVEEIKNDESLDPHYREMLKASSQHPFRIPTLLTGCIQYPDAPNSWYIVCLAISVLMALVIIYKTDSTLPWYV